MWDRIATDMAPERGRPDANEPSASEVPAMPRRPRNPSGFVRARQKATGRSWQAIVKYPDPDKPGEWKQRSATFERKAEAQA